MTDATPVHRDIVVRPARAADASALRRFTVVQGGPDADSIEAFIRTRALPLTYTDDANRNDFRLLLFRSGDQLVAVAAHEANWRFEVQGVTPPGREIVSLAVAADSRFARAPSGRPLLAEVLRLLLEDVRARAEGGYLVAFVHPGNDAMLRLLRRPQWRWIAGSWQCRRTSGTHNCWFLPPATPE